LIFPSSLWFANAALPLLVQSRSPPLSDSFLSNQADPLLILSMRRIVLLSPEERLPFLISLNTSSSLFGCRSVYPIPFSFPDTRAGPLLRRLRGGPWIFPYRSLPSVISGEFNFSGL